MEMLLLLAGVGVLCLLLSLWLWRRPRRRWRIPALLAFVIAASVLGIAAYRLWYTHRPQPAPLTQPLFEGVTYTCDVRSTPRPLVIHVVQVDLTAPGVDFFVTPPEPDGERALKARTGSTFLAEFGVQLAINANFFTPWRSVALWDYYPHAGDPVDVLGLAASAGQVYGEALPAYPAVYFSADNVVTFDAPAAVYHAIAGNRVLLAESAPPPSDGDDSYTHGLHPRTAIGLDADGAMLFLVVVDGRQPNYSEGVTLPELSAILLEYGAYTAVNLDGGGSTVLVIEGEEGEPLVLNTPIDNAVVGRERPVANHLGLFAARLTQ